MSPPFDLVKEKLMAKPLPDTGEPWVSLQNGIEYQPAANLSPLAKQHLRRLTEDEVANADSFEKIFVDGAETYYDEYSQAWRALGFYIDCDYQSQTAEDAEASDSGCQRFMLWAAYVDEGYSGNGAGEYMYFDRHNNHWNDQTCSYQNSNRCVKMDCHLSNTHFSLLGFFKEPDYGDWFEQLFNYEGDCVWTDEEYKFMQSFRDVWPKGCTEAQIVTNTQNGNSTTTFYYDIMPSLYGEMEIGLYKDAQCIEELKGSLTIEKAMRQLICSKGTEEVTQDIGIDNLCATNQTNFVNALKAYQKSQGLTDNQDTAFGDLWGLVSQIEKWNQAFDVYKQCQPCKTSDLTSVVTGKNYQRSDDRYNWTSAALLDGDEYGMSMEVGDFRCNDATSSSAVNQCMRFRSATRMMTAHWNDVQMAITQGSIAGLTFPGADSTFHFKNTTFTMQKVNIGKRFSQQDEDFFMFLTAFIVMVVTSLLFGWSLFRYKAIKEEADEMIKEPLIASEGIAA